MISNEEHTTKTLYSELPASANDPPTLTNRSASKTVRDLLYSSLPRVERATLDQELTWSLLLGKHTVATKKDSRSKKRFLTRKQRVKCGLLRLPKTGWDYESLEEMRQMWREYMRSNLDEVRKAPNCTEAAWSGFSVLLAKSEIIGADITVERSKSPSCVGVTGTVVLETKATLQIVDRKSQLKMLLKEPSVFTFMLDNIKFTIFGKHMLSRPNERSVKKIKLQMIPDLI